MRERYYLNHFTYVHVFLTSVLEYIALALLSCIHVSHFITSGLPLSEE